MRTMLTLALLAISISEPAFAQALARVGGVSITLEQVIAADPAAKTDPVARQKALIALIDRQAVINEARNSGLAKSSIYKAAVAEADQNLLINLSAQKYIQDHPISDQMISETYKAVFEKPAPVEYRFRQIIVDSYSSAKTVLTDLKDGQDFSILAGTTSKDASADAPILKAIKNLKVSEVAGPISIPQGYAVIQLLATRGAPKPTLDQVKGQLTNALEQQEWVNEIIKLRKAQGAQLIVPLSGN
jgi:peptidyl-prolyl cis-trans isomerase C